MHALTPIEEKELLQRLRDGNAAAFMELYNQYKSPLAAKLIRLLKSHEHAQDTLQDIFANIWERRKLELGMELGFIDNRVSMEVTPLYIEGNVRKVPGLSRQNIVVAVEKLTVPDKKYLRVELMEGNGGRN